MNAVLSMFLLQGHYSRETCMFSIGARCGLRYTMFLWNSCAIFSYTILKIRSAWDLLIVKRCFVGMLFIMINDSARVRIC